MLLQGKKAIITGATRGIGKAIAYEFAKNGADILVIGTNEEKGREVIDDLKAHFTNGKFLFSRLDVSSSEEINGFIEQRQDFTSQANILVNSAGIVRDNLMIRLKESDWDEVLDTNLKSVFNMTNAVLRSMIRNKGGSIVNITSVVGGCIGNPGQVNYAASKAGIVGLTKSLAKEVAAKNIRVNCIAPGIIETDMTAKLNKEKFLERIPMKKVGTGACIAKAALFLVSDSADYITGHTLTVDGGMTC